MFVRKTQRVADFFDGQIGVVQHELGLRKLFIQIVVVGRHAVNLFEFTRQDGFGNKELFGKFVHRDIVEYRIVEQYFRAGSNCRVSLGPIGFEGKLIENVH